MLSFAPPLPLRDTCFQHGSTSEILTAGLQGGRWFGGHWFYKTVDTALAVKGEDIFSAIDKRRIFRASDYDNKKGYATVYALASIHR